MRKNAPLLMIISGMCFAGLTAEESVNNPSIQVQMQKDGQSHFYSSEGANEDSEGSEADVAIMRQIENKIQAAYSRYNINVRIFDGVVVLKGTVNNAQDKDNIEKLVRSIQGVSRINNQLEVNSNPNQARVPATQPR